MAGGKGGNLGKASLVLTTKDGGLKRGLSGATSSITGWASSVKGKVAGALGVVSGLLAGFSAGKLTGNISDLAGVGKQANALGIASDTFMGLGAAAKQAGIEQEQFGTLIQKAQLKIAEGSGETAAALGRMGMTLGDLRGKNPADIFFSVAKGLEGVGDQGTKALIASKLFEEEGVKLLPVFAKGEQGLRDYVAQMKGMGVALDGEQMGQVMRAQAAMTRVEQRAKGFWNKLTVFAAPLLEQAVTFGEKVLDWMPTFDQVEGVAVGVFRAIGVAGGYTWDALSAGVGVLQMATAGWGVALGKIAQKMADLVRWGEKLPGMFGGNDFKAAADWLDANGGALVNDSKAMGHRGLDRIEGFGQSADRVRTFFDNKEWKTKGEAVAKPIADVFDKAPAVMQSAADLFGAALVKGSREEYSARIRFQAGGQSNTAAQLAEAKKTSVNTATTAAAVNKLADRLGQSAGGPKLGVIR